MTSTNAPKWAICFNLTRNLELVDAMVGVWENDDIRTIVKTLPGPFDSPEDVLATFIELIEAAEYAGEQLRLPVGLAEE